MGKRLDRRRKSVVGPRNLAARAVGSVITVTRRDALVRELDTAVSMWFLERDPLSIHLIVMAAHQCLTDLGKDIGKAPLAREHVGDVHFGTAYDWLRHASSDPNDLIDFPPMSNHLLLWDATISFQKIFGGSTPYMKAFQAYCVLWHLPGHPDFRKHTDAFLPEGVGIDDVFQLSRAEFFVKLTEMFAAGWQLKP
jgi:hypothetical protein